MDDGTRVEWREWGESAFEEAEAADEPVLLSLTATWCDHCHEMDAETYADPAIAANVHDDFVPVRVDVDRNPRVRDRYNMGGFPSTVFLTPDGSLLTGAGYLGPEGMRQVLDSVRRLWSEKGADAARVPRALRDDEPPGGALTEDVETRMVAALRAAYDEVAGGWGDDPKFPVPDALEFALKRDREMALRSFDAVGANLFDEHEGGFYRYATNRDWSGVHHEKLLDANAALVRAFANAYCYTGDEVYREPAARTIEYLTTTLWLADAGSDWEGRPDRSQDGDGSRVTDESRCGDEDGITDPTASPTGAFAGSQAPGEPESYTLEASDRVGADDPPVDETVYAGSNALAVDALLTYAGYTDDERARRYAERALTTLRDHLIEDGVVVHYRSVDDRRAPGEGTTGERCLLVNQARALRALTTARSVLGADVLEEARSVADRTIDRLRDGETFLDGPRDGPGLLSRSLRPLDANVELADALVDLSVLAADERYREVARETLASFAGASDRFGVQVAGYASAVARVLDDPLVIRVDAPVGSDLHRAALRVADHEKVVVPGADASGEREAAVVSKGDRVAEAAETPDELGRRVGQVIQ